MRLLRSAATVMPMNHSLSAPAQYWRRRRQAERLYKFTAARVYVLVRCVRTANGSVCFYFIFGWRCIVCTIGIHTVSAMLHRLGMKSSNLLSSSGHKTWSAYGQTPACTTVRATFPSCMCDSRRSSAELPSSLFLHFKTFSWRSCSQQASTGTTSACKATTAPR